MDSQLPVRRGPGIARLKRDEAVRRMARRIVTLVPALDRPEWRPLILNYSRVAVLAERAYNHLREAGLLDDHGELKSSLETYRRLAGELRAQARELGLSPTVAVSLTQMKPMLDLEALRNAEVVDE